MKYVVTGFTVKNNDYSEVAKWINERAKEGFEFDGLDHEFIGSGQLVAHVIVVMRKQQDEAVAEKEVAKEKQETKAKSKTKE